MKLKMKPQMTQMAQIKLPFPVFCFSSAAICVICG